jgi:hypothetical protein
MERGFIFKAFNEFDGLGIHIDTFKAYLDTLPKNDNGWVHFVIHDNPPKSTHPKTMMPQYNGSPKEVTMYLWEMRKPGIRRIPFDVWLRDRRGDYTNEVKQDSGEERL